MKYDKVDEGGIQVNEIKCPACGKVFQVDESGFESIVRQVRDGEFERELEKREAAFRKEKQSAVELAKEKERNALLGALAGKDGEIARLDERVKAGAKEKEQALGEVRKYGEALKKREAAFQEEKRSAVELAKEKERNALLGALAGKDGEIARLDEQVKAGEEKKALAISEMINTHAVELKIKDEQIAQYRDFKARLNTKLVGESLERHCEIEFARLRSAAPAAFAHAAFGKDSDISAGSKGDYIYRETDGEVEIISIMFEMKNEEDRTAARKGNEDFLKKLDRDRREKGCEYAVLVSLLEQDNELYNAGIVDMSHFYPKMYVVRPQCFIPIITVLRTAAMRSLEARRELAQVRNQNIDITNFEENISKFKEDFATNSRHFNKNLEDAVKEIDKAIRELEKTKESLRLSGKNLRIANDKADDFTIKKLTRNSPTMRAMFEELNA